MTPPFTASLSRRSTARFATVALSLLLGACASFNEIPPTSKAISQVALPMPAGLDNASGAWPKDDWWTTFGDAQLARLIDHALVASPSLATAQTRIARAQSATALARSTKTPQVNASLNASYGRLSENFEVPKPPMGPGGEYVSQGQAGVNFGYELDLWGKNAALIRSAEAQLKAAHFDRDAARLALTTAIGRTYAQLAAQYQLQDILLSTQKQRQAIRKLTARRVASGLDTVVELKQAETSEAALRVDLSQLATTIDTTRIQLAVLSGDMPTTASGISRPTLSSAPFTVPQNLPLDLLGRRPELAAQRARIDAAIGQAESARAEFYPNVNLTGLIGFQAIGLGQLFASGSLMNSVGPAIRLPIFDGGRLRANYASKASDIDTAIAQYNESVFNAAQDVAEQLTRIAALAHEEEAARSALAAAKEAYRLAMLRYQGGLSPYLTVLTVETQFLAQQRVAADINAKRQDLQIGLIRALGGGFKDTDPPIAAHTRQ